MYGINLRCLHVYSYIIPIQYSVSWSIHFNDFRVVIVKQIQFHLRKWDIFNQVVRLVSDVCNYHEYLLIFSGAKASWVAYFGSLKSLTHWGRVKHICIGKLTIIGLDNGLSPERRQAIIWTNTGILLIGHLGTNCSETLSKLIYFHSRKCIWRYCLRNGVHCVSASMF